MPPRLSRSFSSARVRRAAAAFSKAAARCSSVNWGRATGSSVSSTSLFCLDRVHQPATTTVPTTLRRNLTRPPVSGWKPAAQRRRKPLTGRYPRRRRVPRIGISRVCASAEMASSRDSTLATPGATSARTPARRSDRNSTPICAFRRVARVARHGGSGQIGDLVADPLRGLAHRPGVRAGRAGPPGRPTGSSLAGLGATKVRQGVAGARPARRHRAPGPGRRGLRRPAQRRRGWPRRPPRPIRGSGPARLSRRPAASTMDCATVRAPRRPGSTHGAAARRRPPGWTCGPARTPRARVRRRGPAAGSSEPKPR